MVELDHLEIRGAREHNLRGVDVDIPKKRLVVFTGVSGSGKSSLAFDTLFAEGQRRYVESLSAYARQFLGQMEKPHYDSIRGLAPTISIEQKTSSRNPRSTVGTITEIYDYLRVLFARVGVQHCPECRRQVAAQSAQQMVDTLMGLPEGTKYVVLAPLVENRKGEHREVLDELRAQGFARVQVDGELRRLDEDIELDKKRKHNIDVVVDRLKAKADLRSRLTDSVETALRRGDGLLKVHVTGEDGERLFSEHNYCSYCKLSFPELSPQSFSFNSPLGMCRSCNGLGTALELDPARLVPDDTLSLEDGAIKPWRKAYGNHAVLWAKRVLAAACEHFDIPQRKPWAELTEAHRKVVLYGSEEEIQVQFHRGKRARTLPTQWEGVVPIMMRRWEDSETDERRLSYAGYFTDARCRACDGQRLRPESRAVLVGDKSIIDLNQMTIGDSHRFLGELPLEGARAQIARDLLREIIGRLRFLNDVGLSYLTLDRPGPSLSGGESQRIRLASQMGSELTGVLYVLDEPSIGLHPRDNRRLIGTLEHLRDVGNSVLVVEHDAEMMETADWIVDFGPGAGRLGGTVVASGTPAEVMAHPESLTGGYLSGRLSIDVPPQRRPPTDKHLRIHGASANNLQNLDVRVPVGLFTCVTGVSGAGKSTLVNRILYPLAAHALNGAALARAEGEVEGLEHFDKCINIDQSPIGRTPRSNPSTYTKVFDEIRGVFAQTAEARTYGFKPGRFSFNVKGGRCEACQGAGQVKVEMHFLADVYVPCEVCAGKRFNEATLRVRYRGLNIAELLELTIDEAAELFANHKKIARILQTLQDVGLGYVHLGQPSNTLSGGEAQRIKLSRELARRDTGRTLYILDEPSTGLHFEDVRKLLVVVQRLVDAGNTVVMIEHNLDIIKTADWVVDLGPEGGDGGGQLVAEGSPEAVARVEASHTGRYLAPVLGPA
ncbi:MAG: excinuclease ABC subunit UvrA [Myxococcales bacterium]|nr:excinuclease ABC subunit UvrA [Myxococcales bacterium]